MQDITIMGYEREIKFILKSVKDRIDILFTARRIE